MARVIVPVPAFTEVLAGKVGVGDWISDDAVRWHLVRERRVSSLLVGDTEEAATEVPADFTGTILRLDPSAAPRTGW
jgi:hypothetical protein